MAVVNPDNVFRIHQKIRWAGLTTAKGEVIFSKMRPGVESVTPEEDDRKLLEIGVLMISGICERTTPWAGPVEYMMIGYEKFHELIMKLKDEYLSVTIEKDVPPQTIVEIVKSIQLLT